MTLAASGRHAPGSRRVLLVDDDTAYLMVLRLALRAVPNTECTVASTAEEALARLGSEPIDLVLTDVNLPGRSGIELIASAREKGVRAPMLVLTAHGSVSAAVEALKHGASDYLQKPVEPARLCALVRALLASGPSGAEPVRDAGDGGEALAHSFEGLLGRSPAMTDLFARIERVAQSDATVLVLGESGTGKELVARAIHRRGPRVQGPFVPVHTGAIPRELIASELFGHEKGAFTGASASMDGKFDAATRGTLFLDEIATMDVAVQVSLLRVLESFRFTRVGGRREREADVRIVAATNRDLLAMAREGTFREDLYYRLGVLTLTLPPLREREGDVELLAEHYLREFARRYGTPARRLSPAAVTRLREYAWPGNVRELRNVIEQTAVFAVAEEVSGDALKLLTPAAAPVFSPAPANAAVVTAQPPVTPPPAPPSVPAAPTNVAAQTSPPSVSITAVPSLPSVTPAVAVVYEETTEPARLARAARRALRLPEGEALDADLVLTLPLGTTIADMERALIVRTLEVLSGNKQRAAKALGISRRSLYNKLASYGMHAAADSSEDPSDGDEGPGER